MSGLKVGDRVSFLRMSNKAVQLTGTLKEFCEDGKCANVEVDGVEGGHVEMASMADVTPLETPAEVAADLRSEGIGAAATPHGIVVDVPKVSYTTVNGKAI